MQVVLQADGEEIILPLPFKMAKELGLRVGDDVVYEVLGDGKFSLTKVDASNNKSVS